MFGATTFRDSGSSWSSRRALLRQPDRLPKVVFSTTLDEPLGWENSTPISEDAGTAVERLKRETDVPMRSHGSIR